MYLSIIKEYHYKGMLLQEGFVSIVSLQMGCVHVQQQLLLTKDFFAGSELHLSPKQACPFVKFYFAAKDFNRRICKIFVGIQNLTPPMKNK